MVEAALTWLPATARTASGGHAFLLPLVDQKLDYHPRNPRPPKSAVLPTKGLVSEAGGPPSHKLVSLSRNRGAVRRNSKAGAARSEDGRAG